MTFGAFPPHSLVPPALSRPAHVVSKSTGLSVPHSLNEAIPVREMASDVFKLRSPALGRLSYYLSDPELCSLIACRARHLPSTCFPPLKTRDNDFYFVELSYFEKLNNICKVPGTYWALKLYLILPII